MSISALLSNHRGPAPLGGVHVDAALQLEALRARRHPISRWYICPLATRLTAGLIGWPIRPWHLTLSGLVCGIAAACCVVSQTVPSPVAAILVLAAWFFDRADGVLARRLGANDRSGAWLDANTDEIVDLGLQVSVAAAAARATASNWPWIWLVMFLLGKYLLMHGFGNEPADAVSTRATASRPPQDWIHRLYHLPGNADVRVHLLAAALLTGWLTEQLAVIAMYYNLRWLIRYAKGLKQAVEAPS